VFAGVEAKQLAGSGEWIVSSASRPGIAYRTDGVTCDCEAAMLGGDPVCLHLAAYACWPVGPITSKRRQHSYHGYVYVNGPS
jgi:hypothetical protein